MLSEKHFCSNFAFFFALALTFLQAHHSVKITKFVLIWGKQKTASTDRSTIKHRLNNYILSVTLASYNCTFLAPHESSAPSNKMICCTNAPRRRQWARLESDIFAHLSEPLLSFYHWKSLVPAGEAKYKYNSTSTQNINRRHYFQTKKMVYAMLLLQRYVVRIEIWNNVRTVHVHNQLPSITKTVFNRQCSIKVRSVIFQW